MAQKIPFINGESRSKRRHLTCTLYVAKLRSPLQIGPLYIHLKTLRLDFPLFGGPKKRPKNTDLDGGDAFRECFHHPSEIHQIRRRQKREIRMTAIDLPIMHGKCDYGNLPTDAVLQLRIGLRGFTTTTNGSEGRANPIPPICRSLYFYSLPLPPFRGGRLDHK